MPPAGAFFLLNMPDVLLLSLVNRAFDPSIRTVVTVYSLSVGLKERYCSFRIWMNPDMYSGIAMYFR